jgi:sugar phosphate isomerase/epimerase
MKAILGINTGFALNRFVEHEEWMRIVAEELKLRHVQLTADIFSPYLPEDLIRKQVKKINELSSSYGIKIDSTFTSAFTRVNHLAHPYDDMRRYWTNWLKRFAAMSKDVGARSMGSHFGIMTVKQISDPVLRKQTEKENIRLWKDLAAHAKTIGLECLMWEPMSIQREYGETIAEAERLHNAVNESIDLPMKMCLDVDHGDVSSANPADTDPYVWLRTFAKDSFCVHLKQSSKNKSGHWPFTKEINKDGKILPKNVIEALKDGGASEMLLYLELSFREREPAESRVLIDLKESADFWRPFCEG